MSSDVLKRNIPNEFANNVYNKNVDNNNNNNNNNFNYNDCDNNDPCKRSLDCDSDKSETCFH